MSDKLTPVRCGCGGEAKVAFCQQSYFGQNCFGDKKIKYRVYMICKKCHARGKPIITDWLINPHPWNSIYSGRIRHNAEQDEMFAPYVERAIEAWNRAMSGSAEEKLKAFWDGMSAEMKEERTAKVMNDGVNYCENCEGYVEAPMAYCPYCGCRLEWK